MFNDVGHGMEHLFFSEKKTTVQRNIIALVAEIPWPEGYCKASDLCKLKEFHERHIAA